MCTTCSECVTDVYVGVKTHLCNVHTLPCTSAQNTCSKVHVTLTAGCAHERPCIYACTCMHIHMGAYAPWGDWPIQRAAVYIDGPPFARPHEGRANPSGPSARGPITPCGLAAGGAVFIGMRVPNLTGTTALTTGWLIFNFPIVLIGNIIFHSQYLLLLFTCHRWYPHAIQPGTLTFHHQPTTKTQIQ